MSDVEIDLHKEIITLTNRLAVAYRCLEETNERLKIAADKLFTCNQRLALMQTMVKERENKKRNAEHGLIN